MNDHASDLGSVPLANLFDPNRWRQKIIIIKKIEITFTFWLGCFDHYQKCRNGLFMDSGTWS